MKKIDSSIAYSGTEFTIEWFVNESGELPALDFFKKQSKVQQRKLLNLLRLMGGMGKIFDETKFRNEGNGIYAFKPQPDRYLCFFFKGKKIVVTNAFIKKSQKLPAKERDRALNAFENYKQRVKEGTYYEKN